MTEKKTFKNVLVGSAHTDGAGVEWLVPGEGVYSDSAWDLEVTFTKKVKPVEVDSVVRHRNWPTWLDSGEPIYFVVKAVVGNQAWIGYKDHNREDMLTSLDRLYFDEEI